MHNTAEGKYFRVSSLRNRRSAGSFNKQYTPNTSFICHTEKKTEKRWPFKKTFKDKTTSETAKCEEIR